MAKLYIRITKKWEFPGLWASFPPRAHPLQPQVQKEKSVAIHVIIVKTMISAKQDSAKKSLVHYTSRISVMFFLLMGQISSDLFFL